MTQAPNHAETGSKRPVRGVVTQTSRYLGVVAIQTEKGTEVIPDPSKALPPEAEIVLIGTGEAEERFLELYGNDGSDPV